MMLPTHSGRIEIVEHRGEIMVVSVLDSGAEGPVSNRSRDAVG